MKNIYKVYFAEFSFVMSVNPLKNKLFATLFIRLFELRSWHDKQECAILKNN